MSYPFCQWWEICTAPSYSYAPLDAMERPTSLTDNLNHSYVSGVTYNAANQTSYGGRAYNGLLQVTAAGAMTYGYAANNNGQISSSHDTVTGETITYTYDMLKRLASAGNSSTWSEQYTYDGFGNLNQMTPGGTGGAPSLSLAIDAATNRLTSAGGQYDSNGNVTFIAAASMWLYYDTMNRMTEVRGSSGTSYYGYDPSNLRTYYRDASGNEFVYFYGADGKKVAEFKISFPLQSGRYVIQMTQQTQNLYFTGILVGYTDRLGSVTFSNAIHRYYPYGVEYNASGNDTEKYATYTRDSASGLDYAVNRYYSSIWGRFLSADPYGGSAKLTNPQSWNRYWYAENDPANANDPSGLDGDGFIGSGGGGAPPTTGPAWGLNPFGNGANSFSPCQAYMQAVYAA